MRGLWSRAAAGALLVAGLVLAWQWLFPSEEDRIRQTLEALAEDASGMSHDLSGLAAAAKLSTYFTEDVVIEPGRGIQPLRGREAILAAARKVRPEAGWTVSVTDMDVKVAPDKQSAAVALTALFATDETSDAQEFALTMTKRESAWLISHVTVVETLR